MVRNFSVISAVFLVILIGLLPNAMGEETRNRARGSISFQGPNGETIQGVRCGVIDSSPTLEMMEAWQAEKPLARAMALAPIDIPVVFHVIQSSSGEGSVPVSQIEDQITVLNDAYAPMAISFHLVDVTETINNQWFLDPMRYESAMKRSLAVNPANHLNIYSARIAGGVLGWAYLPYGMSESNYMQGVVLLDGALPGGYAKPFDEGDTGTHEVGHYLGLFHTFQNGCSRPGDYLPDTPFEKNPAYGCPPPGSLDTCPQAGTDPVTNFMDYVDDACMDEFTRQQGMVMRWALKRFRPGLFGNFE